MHVVRSVNYNYMQLNQLWSAINAAAFKNISICTFLIIMISNYYICYEIILEARTTNKHMHNLTSTDTVYEANCIRYSKRKKVIKRKITIMDKQ